MSAISRLDNGNRRRASFSIAALRCTAMTREERRPRWFPSDGKILTTDASRLRAPRLSARCIYSNSPVFRPAPASSKFLPKKVQGSAYQAPTFISRGLLTHRLSLRSPRRYCPLLSSTIYQRRSSRSTDSVESLSKLVPFRSPGSLPRLRAWPLSQRRSFPLPSLSIPLFLSRTLCLTRIAKQRGRWKKLKRLGEGGKRRRIAERLVSALFPISMAARDRAKMAAAGWLGKFSISGRLNALNEWRQRASYLSPFPRFSHLRHRAAGREAKPERTIILSIYLSSSAFKRRGNNDAARETFGNLLRREEDGKQRKLPRSE